ncbi:hypothetical protein FGO68_gene9438 [Halteria grandinella]|uniref:Uncharacterized protein n=1 Tax=Halteria grandinella TaxID=5974 RepID=A0A8J8SWU0_HALGN|nr:hypothetical protein FGO68_gene9438 [Halteria grandinella]
MPVISYYYPQFLQPYIIDKYQCLSCDEGMYLYPQESGSLQMTIHSYAQSSSFNTPSLDVYKQMICVIDCRLIDYNKQLFPLNGECVDTGHYCMISNHTAGCLENYLPTSNPFFLTHQQILQDSPSPQFRTSWSLFQNCKQTGITSQQQSSSFIILFSQMYSTANSATYPAVTSASPFACSSQAILVTPARPTALRGSIFT